MKVFISADMEGATGVTTFSQVAANNPEFERYRAVWIKDINSLAEGAITAGAQHVLINESHDGMNYIAPELIHPGVEYISGRLKPKNQMEGLDNTFDAVFLFAHARAGQNGVLSHSFIFPDIFEMKLNGEPIGELGLNAAMAGALNVPIGLVIGDDVTSREAQELMPGITTVITKRHLTQFTAHCLPVEEIRSNLKQAANNVLTGKKFVSYKVTPPFELGVTFIAPVMTELASYIPGVNVKSARTITYCSDDYFELTKVRILLINLARFIGNQVR